MTNVEYFQRAFANPGYRREQLDELRYMKNVGIGLLVFCTVCFAAQTIYGIFEDGGWDAGFSWLSVIGISLAGHCTVSTRLAALEAMEASTTADPARGSAPGAVAASS